MAHVSILTITDKADFDRIYNHSVWKSYEGAHAKGQAVVEKLMARDTSGFGNTYRLDICLMEVNT